MGLNKIKDKGVQTGTWKILITGPFGGLYQEQTKGTWWCWLRRNMKAEVEGGRGPPHINISFAFQTGLLSKVLIISLVLACTSQVALIIKNLPANARDTETQTGLIPGLGRSPRGGNGNPLQYCCLKKFHGERSLAGYTVYGVANSQTQLSNWTYAHVHTHTYLH